MNTALAYLAPLPARLGRGGTGTGRAPGRHRASEAATGERGQGGPAVNADHRREGHLAWGIIEAQVPSARASSRASRDTTGTFRRAASSATSTRVLAGLARG